MVFQNIVIGLPPVGLMFLVTSGCVRLSAKRVLSVVKSYTFVENRTVNSLIKYCGRDRRTPCHPKTVARNQF